jgi:pimeloyl-ACP methyl ester carboxylesterase
MKLDLNGRAAYAYTGGKPFDPSLPCVVFVHGALNDHSVWALQSRWFAHHGYAVLAVDLPGHGASGGPALESVDAMRDWTLALLRAAGAAGRCAVVGHSMGSLIAMEVAAALGEQAAALLMIATAYPMKVSDALLRTAQADPDRAIDMVTAFSLSTLAAKPSSPGPGTWLHGGTRALMRQTQARYAANSGGNLFAIDFRACDRYGGGQHAARRVRCPVRFVLGAKDQMTTPKSAGDLAQALKADIVTVPAGHSLMGEAPDAVLNALSSFIGRT